MSDPGAVKSVDCQYIRVCSIRDFKKDAGRSFKIGSLYLAVYRSEGKFYAASDICSHEHEFLSEGWLEGCNIECPRHGAQFDLRTGEALSLPATEPIEVFALRIIGEDIEVAIPRHYLNL